jgi:HPt (histidine-containing phosphotransfer) domain-containing protein
LTKNHKSLSLSDMGEPSGLVDWEQLDTMAFGYTPDFVEIYQMFLGQTPEILDALDAACQRGDIGEVSDLAHKLKGSALNFGFRGVSGPMTTLEQHTKQLESLDGAEERILLARENFEAGRREVAADRGI